jgi:hypothetical protein
MKFAAITPTASAPEKESVIDKRNQERWALTNYLRVFDRNTERLVGHVADLTTEGLMLISEQPLAMNVTYDLKMDIPAAEQETVVIVFSARSVWSKPDINPHFYDTGMQLMDPPAEVLSAIGKLVNDLKNLSTRES